MSIFVILSMLNVSLRSLKSFAMNNSANHCFCVLWVSNFHAGHLFSASLFHFWPNRRRNECSTSCGTLLSLIFKRTTNHSSTQSINLGRRMSKNVIFASCLSNDAWVVLIFVDVSSNSLPKISKDLSTASVMNTSHFRMIQNFFCNHHGISRNHIDDTIRQTSFFVDLHNPMRTEHRVVAWFPYIHITHHCWCTCQVRSNSSKVKRSNSVDKTFKRSIFASVPYSFI
mmetsp:Transcript_15291/g.19413  ORF Transcript_15291/g.19413 Transcript_15291/m.19413 type:complete len:227 (-) Transcript_15291:591-1271(-)